MIYYTEKDAIRNLQRYLRQLSYTDKDIIAPPIDSIYDRATADSVRSFQRKYGIAETGVANKETFDAIYSAYLDSIRAGSPPYSLPVFPRTPVSYELTIGDEYFAVSILKLILNELRIVYDTFIPLKTNPVYDEETQSNVLEFQKANGLPMTGNVDKDTWDAIVSAYTNYAYDYLR